MFEEVTSQLPLEINPRNMYPTFNETNVGYIKQRLFQMDELSDKDAYDLLSKTYIYILDETFMSKNIDLLSFLYTNSKFITTLTNVLSRTDITMTYLQKIYCNRLVYDYITARGEKDQYIRALLLNLSKVVNRQYTPGLLGLGLNEELVYLLVNARYSTLKEHIQVKRLNLIILQQPLEVMTVQKIVDIYGKLFDKITPLFNGIMYDHWSNDQFYSHEMEEVYATINVALLEIVNNLPEDIMYHLLKNFKESYDLMHKDEKVRFNIYSICQEDYPRLVYTLEKLKYEGITLPMS